MCVCVYVCSGNVVNVINLQLFSGAYSLFAYTIVNSSHDRTPLEIREIKGEFINPELITADW